MNQPRIYQSSPRNAPFQASGSRAPAPLLPPQLQTAQAQQFVHPASPVQPAGAAVVQAKLDDAEGERPSWAGQGDRSLTRIPLHSPEESEPDFPPSPSARASHLTPLPNPLRQSMEHLSGYALGAVQVHYNSPKPSHLRALACTQGTEIHLAPQQEAHLPHEAWHVVQQLQGRVKPTMRLKDGRTLNDHHDLEREADVMGKRALASTHSAHLGQGRSPEVGPVSARRSGEMRDRAVLAHPYSASTGEAPIQCYSVLRPSKLFSAEPRKRPWFGYPYAIVTGEKLVAQAHRSGAVPSQDFLDANDPNAANLEEAANGFSLRVSTDRQMAVEDSDLTGRQPKVFFATSQVVSASNEALQATGSTFKLTADAGTTVKILTGRQSDVTLQEVTPLFNDGSPDLAPQNCNAIAAKILGMSPDFLSGRSVRAFEAAQQIAPKAGGKYKEAEETLDGSNPAPQSTLDRLTNDVAKEYVANRNSRKVASLGVNQYAAPDVGQAYMIASIGVGQQLGNNTSAVYDYESKTNRTLGWPYHFGGVIARSGSDRITLENYARGDNRANQADPRWYFQMYGTAKGQSFHEFYKRKQDYANPLTLVTQPNQ